QSNSRRGRPPSGPVVWLSRSAWSVYGAVEDGGDLSHFVREVGKLFRENRLDAVGESFFRFVMNFDEQSVGANGDGRTGERQNLVTLPGAMAGVDENGQVAALFDRRDDREVQSVARKVRKGDRKSTRLNSSHLVI